MNSLANFLWIFLIQPQKAILLWSIKNDYQYDYWININYCEIKPGKVILGVSIVDDDPEENYIDTIWKLKYYFLQNNIKKSDIVYISSGTENGTVPIKDFDVKIGKRPNEFNIICR